MNLKYQRLGVWSGIGFFVLFGVACVALSRFIPPPNPMTSGAELVAFYKDNLFGVRLAMMVAFAAATLQLPWSAAVFAQMARIEEGPYPVMAITQLGAGIVNTVAFYLPFVFWSAAIYRIDRAPELVLAISDMAWLEFVMLYAPYSLQALSIAIVGFSDKGPTPTFPRWFCYFSIWIAILSIPGGFAVFFQSGPFAWNGVITFWVPIGFFGIYYPALITLMFRAIKRQETH